MAQQLYSRESSTLSTPKPLVAMKSHITHMFLCLLAVLFLGITAYSQTDYLKNIQGTWNCVDQNGQKQQFTVSGNTWTYNENWPLNQDKTEWQLVNFSGQLKFIKDNKIQIIFHENPREEGVVKIIELSGDILTIKKSARKNMWRTKKYEYQKE